MRLRVLNQSLGQRKCPIVFKQGEMGSWPYGTLFLQLLGGRVQAKFGDLTIPVDFQEMFILIDIATNPHSEYARQW